MKKVTILILLMFSIFLSFSAAQADSFTFDLDSKIVGVPPALPVGETSWGTITISDSTVDSNWVDIAIDLLDADADSWNLGYDLFAVRLNMDDSIFSIYGSNFIGSDLTTSSGYAITAQRDPNGPALDGYAGKFDVAINLIIGDGGPGDGYTDTIRLAGVDLDASEFNQLDTLGNYTGGVYFDWQTCTSVGLSGRAALAGTAPVPEPATMLLFGTGLVGLAGFRRKLFKK